MIASTLLYLYAVVTEWAWSVVPSLPDGIILASYDMVPFVSDLAERAQGFDVFPFAYAVQWIRYGFWAWWASIVIRLVQKVAVLVLGARSKAV